MSNLGAASIQPGGEVAAGNSVSGLFSFLIDPWGAARQVFRKWFWVTPWVLYALVSLGSAFLVLPVMQHVLEVAPPPAGVDAASYESSKEMMLKFGRVASYVSPLTTLLILCLQAGLMLVMTSVMSIPAKIHQPAERSRRVFDHSNSSYDCDNGYLESENGHRDHG